MTTFAVFVIAFLLLLILNELVKIKKAMHGGGKSHSQTIVSSDGTFKQHQGQTIDPKWIG